MLRALPIILSVTVAASASEPVSEFPLERYRALWEPSLFTTLERVPGETGENPIHHYVLGGISRLDDGFFLILYDRRNPDNRIAILPGSDHSIEVVEAHWSEANPIETCVTIREGEFQGLVTFDPNFIKSRNPEPSPPVRPRFHHINPSAQ